MLDIRWIRDNAAALDAALKNRGAEPLAASLITLDDARRKAVSANQAAQERRNALSKEIGMAMGKKDLALAETLKAEVAALKESTPALQQAEADADTALNDMLAAIPNIPAADVPVGADEHGNMLKSVHGERPVLAGVNKPKEHYELGEALGMMDFEAAARMSGARFVVLKGQLARLERAIGQFFIDTHTSEHGYTEVNPPLLVRDHAIHGVTSLEKFADDLFRTSRSLTAAELREADESALFDAVTKARDQGQFDELYSSLLPAYLKAFENSRSRHWLIPTSEAPLTNLVREQILENLAEPMRVTALTPCFRAEAGSAGRDTRGMLRQHQFMKCELVSITAPEQSQAEHERMLSCAEAVLKALGLHYRVMTLCTGDMGFAATKTYDIEVWLPGQDTYREISSCSNCGDFQARRMNARMRGADGKPVFVHTLNGSGVAVGRALIAVMENYQNADGSITVPEVLRPYMGGLERIAR
jgi:seryl-tRNA synthetase